MKDKKHKELWGLYKEMSQFVESRNFRQCKMHHQKLLNKFLDIPQISSNLQKKYPEIGTKLEEIDELYTQLQRNKIEKNRIESQKNM